MWGLKMKTKIILVLISIVVTAALMFSLIFFFVLNYNVETNPSNYLKTTGSFSMDLDIFPRYIEKKNVVKYRYHPKLSILFSDSQYVYLKSRYSKKDYFNEKGRLKKIKNEFTKTRIDKNWLNKESYILYFNYGPISEFAVCNNEKYEIEYVYVQLPEFYYSEKYIDAIVKDKTFDNEDNDVNNMPLGK